MKFAAEGPQAIPLWINGHAFLTVTDGFFDVTDAVTGEVVRRTPLSGDSEVVEAVNVAVAVQPAWTALGQEQRQAYLSVLGQSLDQYTGHFAKLIRQETGCEESVARADVTQAVSALSEGSTGESAGLTAIISDATIPFSELVATLATALRNGGTVIVKPSPKTPGAAFALAELSGRAGFPPGVLNLVHGDTRAVAAICADTRISSVRGLGEPRFLEQVTAIAKELSRTIAI